MNRFFQTLIKFVIGLYIAFSASIAVAFDLDFEDVFYSAYGSYGDKWASYTFLEERVRIPTLNLTLQAASGKHSLSVNIEGTRNAPKFEQVGVTGWVERLDLSFNISTRLHENFAPVLIDTPYVINYFYGYAKGETRVNFEDDVWINYSESGIFGGVSAAWFYNKWLASLNVSLTRGYWFNTTYNQRSSDGGIKSLDGISSGWSLSMNYSVPIKLFSLNSDIFAGFKSNNYSVEIEKQNDGLSSISERLIFYYLGLSYYY